MRETLPLVAEHSEPPEPPRWPRISVALGAVVLLALAACGRRPSILGDVEGLIEEDFESKGENKGKQVAGDDKSRTSIVNHYDHRPASFACEPLEALRGRYGGCFNGKDTVTFPDGSLMRASFDDSGRVMGGMRFYSHDARRIFDLKELPAQLKRLEVDDDHLGGHIKHLPGNLEVLKMPKSSRLMGDLKELRSHGLRHIDLHENEVITGDLRALQERVSDDLEHIDFHSNRVISGQLESLCDPLAFCFKQLQHLDFHQNYEKITGDLEFLRDLTQLRYLDFHANEGITGELYKLQNLKRLEFMDFSQNRNIMGSLWKLQDLKHLKWLDFGYNTQITGDLKDLQNLGQLQHVDFRANMLTGDLKDLQTLKQLQYVDFAFNKQISGDLKDLQSLKRLEHLNLPANDKITGDLKDFQHLKQLRWVNFDFNKQIEGDLSDLKGLEHLQCANFIHSPKITGDLRQRPNIQTSPFFVSPLASWAAARGDAPRNAERCFEAFLQDTQ